MRRRLLRRSSQRMAVLFRNPPNEVRAVRIVRDLISIRISAVGNPIMKQFYSAGIGILLYLMLCCAVRGADQQTALDRYVAAPDPSYAFHLVSILDDGGAKTFVLEMTS